MRRLFFHIALALFAAGVASAAKPTFENRTPTGFSIQDSTAQDTFVLGRQISLRVDLNQQATYEYPVVGHFHGIEKSDQIGTTDTDGMQVDIAMVDVVPFGVNGNTPAPGFTSSATHPAIHMAWIEQGGAPGPGVIYSGNTTPNYRVMYSRSFDGGATFATAVAVTGNLTYHALSTNISGTDLSFSTLDLEVDSGGQPRVVYSFVPTADRERKRNVYLSYSTDGGGIWQTPIQVNDTKVTGAVEGRNSAFPRMIIDDRDNIFISYVRGASVQGGVETDDVMLAKVNRGNFSILPIGEAGAVGTGGIRLTPDGTRATGPELALGDGDALHLVYFNDNLNQIQHKRLATDTTWVDVSTAGWSQDADGAVVGAFVDEVSGAVEEAANFYFPAVVVDRNQLPDRVYSLFKFGDATTEGIYFNTYVDAGTVGTGATWGTASAIWPTTGTPLFADNNNYNVELDWSITERIAAVVDDRLDDRGDLHIAFSAGYSTSVASASNALSSEHDIYYARYNGTSWTLPEKVADDDSDGTGTEDGIATTDVYLLSPTLAQHPDESSVYLAFAGGTGEGFGVNGLSDVNHHPYFKVLGAASTYEDESIPVGAYQYNLSYTPVNPQTVATALLDNPVYVHVADPTNGTGLGAQANTADGFLAGDWESVGTSLRDADKFFEGLIDEDSATTNEWGDDDDKQSLLVKLNVLGSDSATNLQAVTTSSANNAVTSPATGGTVTVATNPSGSFVAAGSYFLLSANVDIVAANSAPTVSVAQPDGVGDQANTSFAIQYSAEDGDDSLGGNLKLALYAYPTNGLKTVQDIRIFGTLIADENDVSTVNSSGTDDLTEGVSQTYTWDDPPTALKSSLFASILRVPSGTYYVYVVADDQKNPPVYAVSSGVLNLVHSPVIQQIDPIVADTVDTGVRTGIKASPYDLDFSVLDHDSEARVQLFYASVSGITSVSATGNYPRQKFVLGKSVSGTRGTAITDSTTLSTRDKEVAWDVSSPLVAEGTYYLYAVATDSVSVSVGNSSTALVVKHSPAFTFYEPAKDTQRSIDSGSQPIYTIQWQKGPGDKDLDHDASIALYFTTDNPSTIDHSTEAGASSTSLTGDVDTKLIVSGLSENSDGKADMYVWDLRDPPNAIPKSARQIWLYAVTTDGAGNTNVVRGGSLTITHNPFIQLNTRLPNISQGDILRFEWDDYMVDDASGTDDAYIRLYAASVSTHTTLQSLETDVSNGGSNAFILNSSTGTATGTITALRESSDNSLNWITQTSTFTMPVGTYTVYAGISADGTFADNAAGRLSKSSNKLVVGTGPTSAPHLSLSPNKLLASSGDTLTFEVLVQSNGQSIESISAIIDLGSSLFSVINSGSPFTDLGAVFIGGTVVENTSSGTKVRFTKNKTGGEIVGSNGDQLRLASFKVAVQGGLSGVKAIVFDASEAGLSVTGSSSALKQGSGLSVRNAQVQSVARGRLLATVLLEGRTQGSSNHSTLLDVHLRLPGSTIDITDATYISANDAQTSTTDTVEILTTSSGGLTLASIPAGRYVLTVKDSSHLSGRTDTLAIRSGETVTLTTSTGFFASDIRGDKSSLLEQDGRLLKGGDATEDNEIDEDDVNTIDAAWGTNTAIANFALADVTNDGRVGVEDLSLATSNISNSTGFGAPPVYKRAVAQSNLGSALEVIAPDFVGEWRAGQEIELVFMARGLGDLAGYEIEFSYDPFAMSVVGNARLGAVFNGNPQGAFQRLDEHEGRITAAGARYGKVWSAVGDGELLRLRVRLHQDGFPTSLRLQDGRLISSSYESVPLSFLRDPSLLAVPDEFALAQNYPNPFNPSTTIPYSVPAFGAGMVPTSVEIFNAIGQRVKVLVQESMQPGYHRAIWEGDDASGRQVGSGIYFYRVRVGESMQVRRMTLVK